MDSGPARGDGPDYTAGAHARSFGLATAGSSARPRTWRGHAEEPGQRSSHPLSAVQHLDPILPGERVRSYQPRQPGRADASHRGFVIFGFGQNVDAVEHDGMAIHRRGVLRWANDVAAIMEEAARRPCPSDV